MNEEIKRELTSIVVAKDGDTYRFQIDWSVDGIFRTLGGPYGAGVMSERSDFILGSLAVFDDKPPGIVDIAALSEDEKAVFIDSLAYALAGADEDEGEDEDDEDGGEVRMDDGSPVPTWPDIFASQIDAMDAEEKSELKRRWQWLGEKLFVVT